MVAAQLRNSPAHLLIIVNTEALLLSHTSELDVLRVQLLLHDLLQRLENQSLRLTQRQGTMVFILQLRLRTLASGPDRLRIISVERSGGLRVVSK